MVADALLMRYASRKHERQVDSIKGVVVPVNMVIDNEFRSC
jgi:hypothetical protein